MKQFKIRLMPSILIAILFALSGNAMAGVVAIVNKANTVADKDTIAKLYTLEAKLWSDGAVAKLYGVSAESAREAFYPAYTGKSAATVKSIWSKAVFTGRAVPLKVLDSDAAVKNEVANDKNAVGYVDESVVDASVRAVR
jgi:ABC-type phosphate transport system substrate-binding protein